MHAWSFAVIAYVGDALTGQVLTSEFSVEEVKLLLQEQYQRGWHIDIGRRMSKAHFLH